MHKNLIMLFTHHGQQKWMRTRSSDLLNVFVISLQNTSTWRMMQVVDNQHRKISGYRDLSEEEIGLMNSVKLHAASVGQQITALEENLKIDKRWLAIAKTDLQKGFMALVRSIAKPEGF